MMLQASGLVRLFHLVVFLLSVVFVFNIVNCGGGGSSDPVQPSHVTLSGVTDDGGGNSPIPNASCRFVDFEGEQHDTDVCSEIGQYELNISPNLRGYIICSPQSMPNLALSTFISTLNSEAGKKITNENVTPATTLAADIIRSENPADPEGRKIELLTDLVTGQDANLELVATMAARLYQAMLAQQVNSNFGDDHSGGDNDGPDDNDSGGVGGEAGDGADFSPLIEAECSFVVGESYSTAELFYPSALSDYYADGQLDRPNLAALADLVNEGLDYTPTEIRRSFEMVFRHGMGDAIKAVTNSQGQYFLNIPANMPGYIRCKPKNTEELEVGTYVPARQEMETRYDEDVNPATTVFSTLIASQLDGDLTSIKNNYLEDIDGLETQLVYNGGALTAFEINPDNELGDNDVALVAFAATALFNAFNKNQFDVDFLAAVEHLAANAVTNPLNPLSETFLIENGIPTANVTELATLVNSSLEETGQLLDTNLAAAFSTARIKVRVTMNGEPVQGAQVDIVGRGDCDDCCRGCEGTTDADGRLTLTLGQVPELATPYEISISSVSGVLPTTVTTELVAFATVDLDIVLSRASQTFEFALQGSGDGRGTVSSRSGLFVCDINGNSPSNSCTDSFPRGTQITLIANPASGSTFGGWSGSGCSGTGTCVVTMDRARTVTANFNTIPPEEYRLTVTKSGGGNGTVSSNPVGINCGNSCWEDPHDYVDGTRVTLTAVAASGSTFDGWSGGGCSGTGTCVVTMDQARTVTAIFNTITPEEYRLTVTKSGGGNGTVSSNPAGINCGNSCVEYLHDYVDGTRVTLTAVAASGSIFDGWSGGGCSGTGTCVVTMDRDRRVTAIFNTLAPEEYRLTVTKSGDGNGAVSSNPGGINCGNSCAEDPHDYVDGTRVTLTAVAASGSTFAGWSGGGCSGTGTCTVIMDRTRTVTAIFNTIPPQEPPGLVVHLPFNGNMSDASGNGNHGSTLLGRPIVSNGELVLDGRSMIRLGNSSSFSGLDSFTTMAWVRYTWSGYPAYDTPAWNVRQDVVFRFGHFWMNIRDTRKLRVGARSGESCPDGVSKRRNESTANVNPDVWTHVATSYNYSSRTFRIYINGSLSATIAPNTLCSDRHNQYLTTVGGRYADSDSCPTCPDGFFRGSMDEVRIYRRVLGGDEIRQVMALR